MAGRESTLEFRVLGPFEVGERGQPLDVGVGKQRALLALLLLSAGEVVSTDTLVDALWGDRPPASAQNSVRVYVSHLRRALGNGRLLTRGRGYLLGVEPEQVDAGRFERLLAEGREALAAGQVERAAEVLQAALALWRGPALLDFATDRFAQPEIARLEELRLAALEERIEADLALGRHRELVAELEALVVEHPYRERLRAQLMLALYRSGRQAEALQAYQDARRTLADELGLEPGQELRELEQAILRHDRALPLDPHRERAFQLEIEELPSSFQPLGRAQAPAFEGREHELASTAEVIARRRFGSRRAALVAAAGAVVVAAVLIPLLALGGSSETAVVANSIVALSTSGSIADTVPVGARPVAITSGAGALWVANLDDQSVTRVDVPSRQAVRDIRIAGAPTALAASRTAVWVTHGTRGVSKIDPRYDRVSSTRQLVASETFFETTVRSALFAFGWIWIVSPDGKVLRIDHDSLRVVGSVGVGSNPSAIAAGAGSVWVTNRADGTVTRIDPATLLPTTPIPVGHGPAAVAVNAAGAWIANAGDDTLVRVDTETNAVAGTTRVGDGPTAILATPAALWVANGRDGTVTRLDPRSGKVTKTIRLGGTPDALAAAGGKVWVAVAPAPPRPPPAGGVAHFTLEDDFASLDPALFVHLALPVHYATCANLVTYPDKPAPEGSRIVPEVAEAVPAPTAGGTTYIFKIRPGFRFSPPSHEAVTAMTFKSTIERVTNPRLKSEIANAFSGIVGYQGYIRGKAREISGVIARGSTLTIRLSHPDGAFLNKLAGGSACAVPRDTPADAGGINDIPSAGPYYIASYTPRQQLVLRRNPNYHGERPHRLDQIVYAIGVDRSRAVQEIEAGKADFAPRGVKEAGRRLESAYGPGSKAAKAGHQQYFVSAANGVLHLHMNTSRPLFSQVRLRRAVNYAIDRPALTAQARRFPVRNPFNAGEPTDDYIPPSTPGATDFHLYPLNGPDLPRAKRIAGRVHATAIMYASTTPPWPQEAQIISRDLKPLGIDVQVKEFPRGDFFTRLARRREPFDLAVAGWAGFSPEPADGLSIFDGSTIGPKNNTNLSYFNDPVFNRRLKALARLSGAKRYRAASRLALELERDGVPAAAIATTTSRDFFSARIGCQVYQPFYGIDIAALCLRR